MSMTNYEHLDEGVKQFMDWFSLSAVVTTIMGIIPEIAAILPLVWYSIRIYETETVQNIVNTLFKTSKDDIDP